MNEMVKSERKDEIVVYQPNETMRLMELDPAVILGLLP